MLIDTHCHLDAAEFDADRDGVIGRLPAAGVDAVLIPAVAAFNFEAVRVLAHRFEGGRYALGIHPLCVDRATDEDLVTLRAMVEASLDDARFVAIGEVGLDHFVPGLDRDRQEHYLRAQLALARDYELPVLLHVRRAQDHVLKLLRRARPVGGIAHAFNGSMQQAMQFLELGCALGFGGAMTFTRALQIRRLASGLPEHAHVLETDSPDISPAWLHPERNEPAQVAPIADVLAGLRGTTRADIEARTAANAMRVLPRLRNLLGSTAASA